MVYNTMRILAFLLTHKPNIGVYVNVKKGVSFDAPFLFGELNVL